MKLFSIFKKKYIVDYDSWEIHKISTLTNECQIFNVKDSEKIYTKEAKHLLNQGYDKCEWCFPKDDINEL
ncbi:hypothetical protein M0Q50_09715 [bacterium]|jgi:hypothetical protein|nr:hypothetical protein [bacterium]